MINEADLSSTMTLLVEEIFRHQMFSGFVSETEKLHFCWNDIMYYIFSIKISMFHH